MTTRWRVSKGYPSNFSTELSAQILDCCPRNSEKKEKRIGNVFSTLHWMRPVSKVPILTQHWCPPYWLPWDRSNTAYPVLVWFNQARCTMARQHVLLLANLTLDGHSRKIDGKFMTFSQNPVNICGISSLKVRSANVQGGGYTVIGILYCSEICHVRIWKIQLHGKQRK